MNRRIASIIESRYIAVASVLAIFLFFWICMRHSLDYYHGNYSGFIQISTHRFERNPLVREREDLRQNLILKDHGYDGEFFYFMAFDPFLTKFPGHPKQYRKVVDGPPYRYGRIGFTLLTCLFSLNNPEAFPKTMVLLVTFSHLLGAFFLVKIAMKLGRNPLWALLYILIPGFSVSLVDALPESIATAFLLGGIYFYISSNPERQTSLPADKILSVIFFAISLMIRETGVVVIFAMFLIEWLEKRNFKTAILFVSSVVPYILWKAYITWRLWDDYGILTFIRLSNTSTIPFAGLIKLFGMIDAGKYNPDLIQAAKFFPIVLIFVFLLSVILLIRQRSAFTISLFCYALLSLSLEFEKVWRSMPNAERTSYEVFLICIVVMFVAPKGWMRYALIAVFGALLIYDLYFCSVAASFRSGFRL